MSLSARGLAPLLLWSSIFLPLACGGVIAPPSDDATTAATVDAGPAPPPPLPPEPPAPPPVLGPLVVDLGPVTAGQVVSFVVPSGALGFNIVVQGLEAEFDENAPIGIARIVDPNGIVVHDDFTPTGGDFPTSIAFSAPIAAVTVPQSEAAVAPLTAGRWTAEFGQYGTPGSRATMSAKLRIQSSGDGAFHGGRLNVHVHIPPELKLDLSNVVDPAKAATDPEVQDRLDVFFDLASDLLGLDRGQVVYHAARGELSDVDVVELDDAFAVSGGKSTDGDAALHILFTNTITQDGEPVAIGIAPGIPGTPNRFGLATSGIIVAPTGSVEADAVTILHELGHFVGLNHTSEFDGSAFDPLSDTARCADIANGDLEDCPDRSNVMFPAGPIAGTPALSPTQLRVSRGSTVYRAFHAGMKGTTASAPMTRARPAPSSRLRAFRASGRALSPLEAVLASGACGLTRLEPTRLVARFGRAATIAQLKAAAGDTDLRPFLRGRARVALRKLGAP